MTITDKPHTAPAKLPVSRSPVDASEAHENVSEADPSVSPTNKRKTTNFPRDRLTTALSLVATVGGTLVSVIGFAMSYTTLAKAALSWGFSTELAPWFPVGVDASIIAFLALDLYIIRKSTPWQPLRIAAHAMTGATIWFNASSQGPIRADPVQAASHGAMPILFVIGVEAARRLIIQKTREEAGTVTDRIPLHRWILSPLATPRFYRRMRLHNITSYPEMIRRQQELIGYEQWLQRKHDGDLNQATEDELLPMKMAAYGYTVTQALAMPEQQEREAEARAWEAANRRLAAETRQELARKKAESARLQAEGKLEIIRAQVKGETLQAQAQARSLVSTTERAAQLEETALETAVIAEARAREAEAEHKSAKQREAKAATDVRAAQLEIQAAEKRRIAAEADRAAAAEAQAVETAEIAEARRRTAEADRSAAEMEEAAAETRHRAAQADRLTAEEIHRKANADANTQTARKRKAEAEFAAAEARLAAADAERRAVEIEDTAKLTSRQRAVRRVARMALAAGLNPDVLAYADLQHGLRNLISIADVQRELDVSSTSTASKYRQEAVALLHQGYRPKQ